MIQNNKSRLLWEKIKKTIETNMKSSEYNESDRKNMKDFKENVDMMMEIKAPHNTKEHIENAIKKLKESIDMM